MPRESHRAPNALPGKKLQYYHINSNPMLFTSCVQNIESKNKQLLRILVGVKNRLHKMPESLSALLRIVSLTAANTNRMLDVSVAWVRLRADRLDLDPIHFRLWMLRTVGINSSALCLLD